MTSGSLVGRAAARVASATGVLTDRRRLAVAGILAAALLLRIGFVAHQPDYRPIADAADFDRIATTLALRGEYPPSSVAPSGGPSAYRPPGYPYLLAAAYRVTGTGATLSRFTVARVLSALLATVIVALVGVIASMLWGWGPSAVGAMLVSAIYPPLVTLGDAILAEPLFTVLVLAAVVTTLAARRPSHRLPWAVASGALVGLAALTRGNGIIALLPISAGIWLPPYFGRASLARVAALVLTTVLVLAPWTVRNTAAFHQFVPLSTEGSLTLAGTYNDVSRLASENPAGWRVPTMAPYDALRRHDETEAKIEQRFRSEVLRFIGEHPGYVLKVAYFNVGRLLGLQGPSFEHVTAPENGIGIGTSNLDVYSFYVLAVLVIGALALGALRRAPAFLWSVPVFLALSLIFVTADMRYRFAIDPFLILLIVAPLTAYAGIVSHIPSITPRGVKS